LLVLVPVEEASQGVSYGLQLAPLIQTDIRVMTRESWRRRQTMVLCK
jgi:hypothetical protein